MKKSTFLIIGLLYSAGAVAAENDFSVISRADGHFKQVQKCLNMGWKAASPTGTQKTDAQVLIEAASTSIKMQKEQLKKDMQELMKTWANYPIVNEDVEAAESRLRTDMIAVHKIVRDDLINVINLLSAEQKALFNKAFKACFKPDTDTEESNWDR